MNAKEFAKARGALGLNQRQMGEVLGLRGDPGRSVRRYETGVVEIPGPVALAMFALKVGFRPPWWPKEK